jgi:hypothetical protein
MHKLSMIVATMAALLNSTCAKRVPEPAGVARGTPHISWIIMSGDSDNPDREFVCQSEPRNECVIPVSRPDEQVFSDVHFYYHGAGAETKYTGSIDIGFFQGSPGAHTVQANTTVKKTESIMPHSITGIVTSTPGTYALTFALDATVTETGKSQPIRERVSAVVK